MPTKVFDFNEDGLAYSVTLNQDDGGPVMATVTVHEGQMDVNAIYYADDDQSNGDVSLGGPLNMNGGGSRYEGEAINWDGAEALSRPGLGREGESKETFLTAEEGENELGPFHLTSDFNIDEIEYVGVRATSTSTPEGSIKGVATGEDEPEEPEDPDCELPEGTNKVFFALPTEEYPENGLFVREADLDLEEGEDATLQDYYDTMLASLSTDGREIDDYLSEIVAYNVDVNEDGVEITTELARFSVGEELNQDTPLPEICTEDEAEEIEEDSEEMLVA